jgi:hypothetical protein
MVELHHVVMIGAGIGVSPFASVLQSIRLRRRAPGAAEALQKVVPMEQSLGGTLRDLIPIAAPILTSVVQSLTAD